MAGKGGKGLLAAKTTAANKDKDKDKKKPVSRSSRAGLQVRPLHSGVISGRSRLVPSIVILEDNTISMILAFFLNS